MKCPHCAEKVSVFSKAMNSSGRSKTCPHCGKTVKPALELGRFTAVFLMTVLAGIVVTGSTALSCAIAGGAAALLGMRLNPA